jgi:methyltransferase of ATP-grasp peptide maturase system
VTFDINGRAALLRRHLAEQLTAGGQLRSPAWRAAVEAVPRHEFVPQLFRMLDGPGPSRWEPVTPERVGADRWLELTYADDSLVTQLDGVGRPSEVDEPVVGAVPTSSATMPSLVVRMWEDLRVDDDARVLEIGTGTGYSTALGCQRLGEDQVTSVEVDPELAGAARAALERAGYRPALVVGDGLRGYPARARYDRVIATCAVRTVPAAWMEQTRPGGLILVTVSGWLHGSGLALLRVTDEDTAEGRFLPGDVSFMPARPHQPPLLPVLELDRDGDERPAREGPDVLTDWTARFVAQLAAPGAQHVRLIGDDGSVTDVLVDVEHDAYAVFTPQPDSAPTVRQTGPIRLWDAIEDAITTWRGVGEPGVDRFAIRVTPHSQTMRLDALGGQFSWSLQLAT